MGLRRGEVWWANLAAPAGRRPVLLLSPDWAHAERELVTVAPVTTTIRGAHGEVPVGPREGLPYPSVVSVDNIATTSKRRLASRIAVLAPGKMRQVEDAIHYALDLSY